MSWRLITLDAKQRQCTSAPVKTREDALKWARELKADGVDVVMISSDEGETVVAEEIEDWCKAHS